MSHNKRILVVSHNVIDDTSGMGKTLGAYFKDFGPENIAQFYIHHESPTDPRVCRRYFRFTDIDAIKARLPLTAKGQAFVLDSEKYSYSRDDAAHTAEAIYQYGRKRTGMIYSGRELVWQTAFWNTKKLRNWVRDFAPDIVFFASGDYAFMYDIAAKIADMAGCPLFVSCMDDYYTNNINSDSRLGRAFHSYFMKKVHRTMEKATRIFCMCDQMSEIYSELFKKPTETLYTPAEKSIADAGEVLETNKISYVGRLGVGRYQSLIDIGNVLSNLKIPGGPDHIDVYANEKRHDVLKKMEDAAGVVFHGPVSPDRVPEIIRDSMMVIHTESFDERFTRKVRYSISTKIAESLVNGSCIFAYGPTNVASIRYLAQNDAAIVATDREQLAGKLLECIQNKARRRQCIHNAHELGELNHSPESVFKQLNRAFSTN